MVWAHGTEGDVRELVAAALEDEFADHGGEAWVVRRSLCAEERHAQFGGEESRFFVEVVEYFHVVADEADGADEDVVCALCVEGAHVVENVGFEPRLIGCAAAGLIDEIVVGDAGAKCNEA